MFPERLKELRKASKMTQKQLAEKLFVDQTSVSYWETGKTKPDFDKQIELAKLFNVSLDYLLGLPDKKNSPAPDRASEEELQKLRELVKALSPQQQEELYRYGKYLASQRRGE
ncbi:helix-turn-helix domain-containing protein [Intestinibacillus sp. Marseille-P6563]|uniref:helix-turn-helix domain-containing protein n=1 Tax=Intestinibacillus sp. Marseille-P6563 TaxID=2364792 RepID=UPI000F0547FB|nr:helix-turn-helix transcriptional regulator [Intestinibacillus sp. Marseille-P6563]